MFARRKVKNRKFLMSCIVGLVCGAYGCELNIKDWKTDNGAKTPVADSMLHTDAGLDQLPLDPDLDQLPLDQGQDSLSPTPNDSQIDAPSKGIMRNISSLELVREMKVGWNLGNTLDAEGGETKWGNPVTTKAMIDKVKARGFNTLRIPITWDKHVSITLDYTIDKAWMDRVEEVVTYGIDNGMYVIINTHHEGEWLKPTYADESTVKQRLTKIWAQISKRFINYSDYLVFEVMNEPRVVGSSTEWTGGTSEYHDVINKLNLAAVNTIRNSGGNNKLRHIMIPTHAASSISAAVDALVIPNNDNRIIVSLHMYSPYFFAMDVNGTSSWGSQSDKSSLDNEFEAISNKFIKNGRAVVVGECGTINKNNLTSRVAHAGYFVSSARTRGIAPIWWDNGVATQGQESYALFNRKELSWYFPEIVNAIMKAAD